MLSRAAEKYGVERLAFAILFVCKPEVLIRHEQAAIDTLKPLYNIAPIAGSSAGIKRSAEFKDKVSRGQRGRVVSAATRALIGAKHKGKRLSPEHREAVLRQLADAAAKRSKEEWRAICVKATQTTEAKEKRRRSMAGHPVSEETRTKISDALRGRPHSPERVAAIMAGKQRAVAVTLQNGS